MPTAVRASFARSDALGCGHASVNQRQFHIVQSGGARQQVEGLEDKTDFFVPNVGEFVVFQLTDLLTVQPVLAAAGRIQAADQVHQRGLARSRRAHDRDILIAADLQIHSAQRVHLLFRSHVIGLPQVGGENHARLWGGRHLGCEMLITSAVAIVFSCSEWDTYRLRVPGRCSMFHWTNHLGVG